MVFVMSPNDPYITLGPDAVRIAADSKTTGNRIVQVLAPSYGCSGRRSTLTVLTLLLSPLQIADLAECSSPQIGLSLLSAPPLSGPRCLIQARLEVLKILTTWQTQNGTLSLFLPHSLC